MKKFNYTVKAYVVAEDIEDVYSDWVEVKEVYADCLSNARYVGIKRLQEQFKNYALFDIRTIEIYGESGNLLNIEHLKL